MKPEIPANIEKLRVRNGQFGSDQSYGRNGVFIIPYCHKKLRVIVSDGAGWDHVSVSLPNRCPNWKEMCFIKNLFFERDETVIQFHPKESDYVNLCQNCLHLWKKQGQEHELPTTWMVG
jgi:hypothetical protein